MSGKNPAWDVFISHAYEDKDTFVRPLAIALRSLGVSVWYDEFSLRPGDSLSGSIDKGVSGSAYGLVVISPAFIGKHWTEYELRGLVSREVKEDKVILPIWHGVTRDQVMKFSPTLADKVAIVTGRVPPRDIPIQILRIVRPDIYAQRPRAELERIASGEALQELRQEIERMRGELLAVREELSEYRCPHCGSPLTERMAAPIDSEQSDWDLFESYECGYQTKGGSMDRPCPSDPQFPKFDEYELRLYHNPEALYEKWQCHALPKTKMARRLSLLPRHGRTEEEARQAVRESYDSYARKDAHH